MKAGTNLWNWLWLLVLALIVGGLAATPLLLQAIQRIQAAASVIQP